MAAMRELKVGRNENATHRALTSNYKLSLDINVHCGCNEQYCFEF